MKNGIKMKNIDGNIPSVYKNLMRKFVESETMLYLQDFAISMEPDFFISEYCFQIGDIFMLVPPEGKDTPEEGDVFGLSFNTSLHTTVAANITKFLIESGYKIDIYESFYFDEDFELIFEGDDHNLLIKTYLN